MDLTDNEKRDLVRLIENNQPIPEKYRFKLFEKKMRLNFYGMANLMILQVSHYLSKLLNILKNQGKKKK